jgi:hypothetical protein
VGVDGRRNCSFVFLAHRDEAFAYGAESSVDKNVGLTSFEIAKAHAKDATPTK